MKRLKEIDTGTPNIFPALAAMKFEPSPRLKWRQAHGVEISYHPNKAFSGEWRGRIGLSQVLADTENEAEFALCEKHNLRHYTLDNLKP